MTLRGSFVWDFVWAFVFGDLSPWIFRLESSVLDLSFGIFRLCFSLVYSLVIIRLDVLLGVSRLGFSVCDLLLGIFRL